ncbi:MAG TPA: thiolase family protein [Rhodothermales bacterium]|nr:acetyl-CoA C-acyltransferase [Bacteroidota bacterium]HRK73799.1 thiolase family protein [Rhodothermales bacterium]HRR08881.1 thiolase family protein [Rhodothermales bacterium]
MDAYIVSSVRTAVGRAKRGALRHARPEFMGAEAVKGALAKVPEIKPEMVEDVLMGCAFPEGPQGMNMGRIIAQKAGLPDSVPGATVNRFCSSGLQTIAMAAQAIKSGDADVVVAGGTESMSYVPMGGYYYSPDLSMVLEMPDTYVDMGNTAENLAISYNISREEADAFSLTSHNKALAAIQSGVFKDEIFPLSFEETLLVEGKRVTRSVVFDTDEGPRASTPQALAKLPSVFRAGGIVTAGNASPMSDGAAATVLVSKRKLETLGLKPMARMVGFAVAGVPAGIMGIGPVPAIKKVLAQTGLSLADIGLIELNEAFSAQALSVIKALGLNPDLINVNGGAIALGHPLGCTGAKLTATLLHEMRRRSVRYGIVSMCIGGGMGAAGVFESLI